MQLKLNTELNHYQLMQDDACGLCGEDLPGTPSTVSVAAEILGEMQVSDCAVYTDDAGVMRVANTDEFVRCFT